MKLSAATIIVTTSIDLVASGDGCSLREAILAANSDSAVNDCAAGAGSDVIEFAIGGPGPYEIVLDTDLPAIVAPLVLDGRTQFGASCPFRPSVSITGASNLVEHGFRFEAGADDSGIYGLRIHGIYFLDRGFFPLVRGYAVYIQDVDGFDLKCNVFGVDPNGSVQGLVGYGLSGTNVSDLSIGGREGGWYDNPASNVIVGNYGVRLSGVTGMDVAGNWIGFAPPQVATDFGKAAGIEIYDGSAIHIGVLPSAPDAGGGNVMAMGAINARLVGDIKAFGNRIGVFPDGRELPARTVVSVQWHDVFGASEFGRWLPGSPDQPLANIVSDQGDGVFGPNVTGGFSISFSSELGDPVLVSGNLFLGPEDPRGNFFTHGLMAERRLDDIVLSDNAFTRWPAAVTIYLEDGAFAPASGNNCFEENALAAFNPFPGQASLALPNNWWGSPDGPGGTAPGTGDPVDPDVSYEPFLTQRPASCALLALAPRQVLAIPASSPSSLIVLIIAVLGIAALLLHRARAI